MARARENISPAFAGSVLLHGLVAGAFLISWPFFAKPVSIGVVVPVNIVAKGPPDLRPAQQAPEEQTAQTEEPQPAPPEPAPPPPPPPAPPTPQAKPVPPKPSPAPAPAAREQAFNFDDLQKSIARSRARNPAPRRPVQAPKGPERQETAVAARPAIGPATGNTASAMAALGAQLERLWNPNCNEDGLDVNLIIEVTITADGRLVELGRANNQTQFTKLVESQGDPQAVEAAKARADNAFSRAQPFTVPPDFKRSVQRFRFNAKNACSR